MDVIVMAAGDTATRLAREHRYREPVEEVPLAERVGFDAFDAFDAFDSSEATVSASEVLRPYLMTFPSRTDNWSDEKRPSAALATARTVHHGPAVRAVREVCNG
ncbi:hypothetical protein ACFT8W_42325 [Streptomyces hygroscopicus]|uniref:hypothetical protein n=1 Tax=Streptomyces hygroscopicus TaxID=1912 RepID=UPI00362EB51A